MLKKLLIANRGEIAVRIARTASELGIATVAVFSEDDANALHITKTHTAHPLKGIGAAPYLDIQQLVQAAKEHGCDAVHPGYGFLSEDAQFAQACQAQGLSFVGPEPETLQQFGDKATARKLAKSLELPLLQGTTEPTTLAQARDFWKNLPKGTGLMVKAIAGGGGRGMRKVREPDALEQAFSQCASEAKAAFGNDALYVEEWLPKAQHIEVQIIGDGKEVSHLWERECSLQRRHQKVLELAPAPWLSDSLRKQLLQAAISLGKASSFRGIGTVEFLVGTDDRFAFLEVNPRLQVEHTVTEEVLGLDLVQIQLELAQGRTLEALELLEPPRPRGFALQARVHLEQMNEDGSLTPTGGTLQVFEPPSGPGVRVDTLGYAGYTTSPHFDPLLAKVIIYSPSKDLQKLWMRAYRALCEFRIEGVDTNLCFLQALLQHDEVRSGSVFTEWIETKLGELISKAQHPQLFPGTVEKKRAVLEVQSPNSSDFPEGVLLHSQMSGTVVQLSVQAGEQVRKGQEVAILSAMKMEHVISAPVQGEILHIAIQLNQVVHSGQILFVFREQEVSLGALEKEEALDLEHIRPDLEAVHKRHHAVTDEARPKAVAKRRKLQMQTARENVAQLVDEGSFVEYGALALAAQHGRLDMDTLIQKTPADGIITGVGTINASLFGAEHTQCAVLAYDYTVLAGTQGYQNHRKTDRVLHIAKEAGLPVVFFTEGGGGRPSDTDLVNVMISGLECSSFREFASLSGKVPLIGVNNGRCFAGNAAFLGCCDVIIATERSNIGMGGPAMIEGGGLGVFSPEDIGPIDVQRKNGVVDIVAKDESEAIRFAKQVMGYFQGNLTSWEAGEQKMLRHIIPENRLRMYNIHEVIRTLVDTDSALELQAEHAPGMLTYLARIQGKPLGILANNPGVLAGAIETEGARKATRFMRLCEKHGLPLLILCDTPGIMVGPEAEKTGTVRAAADMFIQGANLETPVGTIVLRKGYGLGAQAMAAGHFKAPRFIVSWPTGEFGPMGLEGAVKLGFRAQLEAIEDPKEREDMFQQMVDLLYERGKALHIASHFEIDDVIDPISSRHWIQAMLL